MTPEDIRLAFVVALGVAFYHVYTASLLLLWETVKALAQRGELKRNRKGDKKS